MAILTMKSTMMRRASDTTLLSGRTKMTKDYCQARNSMPLMLSNRTIKISDHDDSSGIWEGPEEFIRGRMLVEMAGFEPSQSRLSVTIKQNKKKNFWWKDRLDVVNAISGAVFTGSARIQHNPHGFDLIGKSKVVVRCVDHWNATENQKEIIMCSTRPLSSRYGPDSKLPVGNFYRWFKATVDKTTNDFSLQIWIGTQYHEMWYADDIKQGNEIVLTSVTDDVTVGKLCGEEIIAFAGVDPSIMICVGVAMQRLRTPSNDDVAR